MLFVALRYWLPALMTLFVAPAVRADEAYYLLIFGSQRTPPRARHSHTFGTFVKTSGQLGSPDFTFESHTISWLPQALQIRMFALLPECGENFDLHATVRYALSDEQRISLWGPYQVTPDLYERALKQVVVLESGHVRYKALDTGRRSDRVSNCIHAVSTVEGGYRLRVISPSWGETASYYIARRFKPWIIGCSAKHDWVATALGLDAYPIIHREFENPLSGAILSALRLGRE